MAWFKDFLNKMFPVKGKFGDKTDPLIIDIPPELYYKELAIYTATSLIGNAISRSEIKCFENNKAVKNEDYYRLNISPNANETSSLFWHKVINKTVRENEALVIELSDDSLYCADNYVTNEHPVDGNTYSAVTVGDVGFVKTFDNSNTYLFKLDNQEVKKIIDGMYESYEPILSAAAKAFKASNGNKYKLHIDGLAAGDEEFNKLYKEYVEKQLKSYLANDNAVYIEYEGYSLQEDTSVKSKTKTADDFIALKNDMFSMVGSAFHIPDSMMKGNITNMKEIVGSFLTFGIDPFGDMIDETLNKGAGIDNYLKGNYYAVDTSRINHQDIFDISQAVSTLISSGTFCVDEIREKLGEPPLNTDWSKKHFITKNFEEMQRFLNTPKGGEE